MPRKNPQKSYELLAADSYRIWMKCDQNLINCFLYILPSDSNWDKSGKLFNFDNLKQESAAYDNEDNCLLICSDFNARVGLKSNYIQNDYNDEFLPLPDNYISDNECLLSVRKSHDHKSGLHGNGIKLLGFFKMTDTLE